MKKAVSVIILALLMINMLSIAFNIQLGKAEWTGTVYIRADGSIDPPDAPITTYDNITYTLTDNITNSGDGIVVERDNIVIDGASFTLEGTSVGKGICLSGRSNVTIKSITISKFKYGIYLDHSNYNTISGTVIRNNGNGIHAKAFSNSHNNRIFENILSNNFYGLYSEYYFYNNSIFKNNIIGNHYGILLYIYCSGNDIIENYIAGNEHFGIGATNSANNISANVITNCGSAGIYLDYCGGNHVIENNITACWTGIDLSRSSGNILSRNIIAYNHYGIAFPNSVNNRFFHNNMIDNVEHVYSASVNFWDDGYPSGGNYWSDYTGVDLYSGPYQNETGSDGIGDTPYIIDANNRDRYPLIEPWALTPILLKPDLSISSRDLSFSDSNPLEGEIITISATIYNRGNRSARNVLVHFFDGTTLLASKQISFISQGSYGIALIDWTAKDEGFHPIKVVVDPYNAIDEIDEKNNEATRSILVGKIPYTGGIILKGSVTPTETTVGSQVTIQGYAIYNTTYGYGAPVAGAEVTITITGWEQVKTHTINDGTYKAEITAPYTSGNYTIIVTITDFTFQESIELNLSVISIEGIDLTLSSRDITFSPSDPLENQVVNITAKIHNIGTENAYNVSVAFYDNGKPIASQTIYTILAEESKEITITWNATPWGWHTISVIIDPANEIAETNEDNNEASQSIRVYPTLPDLTPIDIRFSDDTPLVNQTITITAIVQNIGGIEASNVLVSFYHEDELIGNATILNIAGKGGTATASLSYAFTTEGWHKICVFADSDNTITEADEENNIYCESIYVHSPLPDLAISPSDITFSNNTPTVGDTITIYATIHNIGEVTAYNVTVEVYVDGSRIGYIMFDSIPEGGKETFDVEWTATPAGWQRFRVVIDSNNTILELNENNNEATRYIYVSPELAPDICVHSEDIVFSNVNPDPGELITIWATVHNVGQADAYNVTVTFYVDDIQIGTPHSISHIPMGGEEAVTTTWIASQTGTHVVKIFADVPIETNKTNNVATRGIIVGEVYFELTITSSPITGITFTVNGTSQTTPYTQMLLTGTYIIEIPETHNGYIWSHWLEDGDTNRKKVITLNQNVTWTAVYTTVPPLSVLISPPTAEIKIGESVTFTSSVSGGIAPYDYHWTFTPTESGIFYVYLKVTDDVGNTTQSETARVTVARVPVGGYSVPINTSTTAKPLTIYYTIIAVLVVAFAVAGRKMPRKPKK